MIPEPCFVAAHASTTLPCVCHCEHCIGARRLALVVLIREEALRRGLRGRNWPVILRQLLSADDRENEEALTALSHAVPDPRTVVRHLHRTVGFAGSL